MDFSLMNSKYSAFEYIHIAWQLSKEARADLPTKRTPLQLIII